MIASDGNASGGPKAARVPALNYADIGKLPSIVLLHSFPADGRIWAGVAGILSQSFRVVTPNLHGFGKNPPASKVSIAEMAADVAGLIHELGIGPCAIAGLSMGGYVAQQIARDHAAVIDRLILVDTKAAADNTAGRDARDATAALAIEHGSAAVFERMLPMLLGPDASPAVVEAARAIAQSQSPLTIAAASRAMRDREDFSAFLPSLTIPVHLIFGEYDATMPPDAARALQATLPSATLAFIGGAGHLSPLEKPADVAAAISSALISTLT